MDEALRRTCFGLDICGHDLPAVLTAARAQPTGRRLSLLVDPGERPGVEWEGGSLVGIQRSADGSDLFRIEEHPRLGYLLGSDEHGRHLLDPSGRTLRCMPQGGGPSDWQRFLIAQVLPFAAVLQGLEVLHASAVAVGGKALALLGVSQAGKTSLAVELCGLGAAFVADDVLAVEAQGEVLLAHPGTPLAALGRGPDEQLRAMNAAACPTIVADVMWLDRRTDGPGEPAFETLCQATPLLASTFNLTIRREERLRRLLEVCAVAARARVHRVLAGPGVSAPTLARAVFERLGH